MNGHSIKFLLAVKNASLLKKEIVYFYYNKLFLKLAKVLYRAGLIQNFWITKPYNKTSSIVILLKYSFNVGILSSLKIISKPSQAIFLNFTQISRLTFCPRVLILSTDKEFLTSEECLQKKIGGKAFFYV
jgi:ribosomal protein S8